MENIELYFAYSCTSLCLFQSLFLYLYLLRHCRLDIFPLYMRFLVREAARITHRILVINELFVMLIVFIIFIVYAAKILMYLSNYLPLSSLYLVWKLDHPEYRVWQPF